MKIYLIIKHPQNNKILNKVKINNNLNNLRTIKVNLVLKINNKTKPMQNKIWITLVMKIIIQKIKIKIIIIVNWILKIFKKIKKMLKMKHLTLILLLQLQKQIVNKIMKLLQQLILQLQILLQQNKINNKKIKHQLNLKSNKIIQTVKAIVIIIQIIKIIMLSFIKNGLKFQRTYSNIRWVWLS